MLKKISLITFPSFIWAIDPNFFSILPFQSIFLNLILLILIISSIIIGIIKLFSKYTNILLWSIFYLISAFFIANLMDISCTQFCGFFLRR